MPQFPFPVRKLRTCDKLLVLILCANFLYIMYHITSPGNVELMPVPSTDLDNVPREAMKKNSAKNITVANEPSRNPCPLDPPSLLGNLACDCDTVTPQFLISGHRHIELGGRIRPQDCQPRERTAIIIPYRDRYEHLHSLLRMLIPILTRQQVDATFFVIEQTNSSLFNRAALHNIGFIEGQKLATFDCFIFHDVDLVPVNDHILYRCDDHNPLHFATSIKFGRWVPMKVMALTYVGGVIGFTRRQYEAINGNSNLYFGYKGEDVELYHRITNKNLTVSHADANIATYYMLFHERQDLTLDYRERSEILKSSKQRQDVEGLNTSRYTVFETRISRLYTWITVSVDMEQVLKTAPIYTLLDIKNALVKGEKT